MKLKGLAWSGAASKAALEKIRTGAIATAPAFEARHPLENVRRPVLAGMRKRAIAGALVLVGLFSLAVSFALIVALMIERYWR